MEIKKQILEFNELFNEITDPAIYILTYNKNNGKIERWKSKTAGS
jgi:hypothetical protein